MQSWSIGNVVIVLALHRTGGYCECGVQACVKFSGARMLLPLLLLLLRSSLSADWCLLDSGECAAKHTVQSCRPFASARAPRLIRLDSDVIPAKRICILRDRGVEIAIDEAERELLSDTDTNNCDRNKTVSALLRCIRVSKYRISIVQYTTA